MKNFVKRMQKPITPRRLKICLAIPCNGLIRIETHLSVVGILANTPHDFYSAYRTSCYVPENRWQLAQTAIRERCDKLFFVDADMNIEPHALNKLLALNKPFVGAAYNMRGALPRMSNVKGRDVDGKLKSLDPETMPKEPFIADGVPTGCMLIDVPTLQRVPQPWFNMTLKEDGSLDRGEDIWFCEQVKRAGFDFWCDPTIVIGHIGTFTY